MPRVHLVMGLLKRRMLGTPQGAIGHAYLDDYLNEFTFRFNRRTSASRGKLFYRLAQQAVQMEPIPFAKPVKPQPVRPVPSNRSLDQVFTLFRRRRVWRARLARVGWFRKADEYLKRHAVPPMLDPLGKPMKRSFVHISDLVESMILVLDHPKARQQTFNICMDEPLDYRQVADYLLETRGMPSVEITTPYWSTWMDNSKAKFLLEWRPSFDLKRLIEEA